MFSKVNMYKQSVKNLIEPVWELQWPKTFQQSQIESEGEEKILESWGPSLKIVVLNLR